MSRIPSLSLLAAATAMCAATLVASPALAVSSDGGGDRDETIRKGQCTGATDWKLKAKSDDGRLEVEAEIDSNRRGQAWRWVLRHNGSVSARGISVTAGRSGSFDVERRMTDLAGTDRFVLRATNAASGETCRGVLTW